MKNLFVFLILFTSSFCLAEESEETQQPQESVFNLSSPLGEIPVDFGDYSLDLTYVNKGVPTPFEGYLLSMSQLAVLKLDIDSNQQDCLDIVKSNTQQCLTDLKACQDFSNKRFSSLLAENKSLVKEKNLLAESYDNYKFNSYFYIGAAVIASTVVTTVILK